MSRNGGNPDLRLRPIRVPDDYPGLTAANQAARSAAGRPSSLTVADLTRYLEHLVNCDPQRDVVVAELDGRIRGYGIVFWRDLVEGGRIVVGHGILAPDARTADTTATLFGWLDERLSVVGAGLTDPRPDYASAFTWVDNALASAFLRGPRLVGRGARLRDAPSLAGRRAGAPAAGRARDPAGGSRGRAAGLGCTGRRLP